MSYHIVTIDSPQCSISCQNGQLVCTTDDDPKRTLPIEDVASIIITSFSAQLHSHLLLEAAKHGVSLIICEKFRPISLLLPANRSSDTLLTKAFFTLPEKTLKTLWDKTIDAKCYNQYAYAQKMSPKHHKLEALRKTAKGKYKNKESTCARYYWGIWGSEANAGKFKRDPDQEGVNSLLNYGYAVLLSQVIQKLLAIGLDPTVGISHEIRERSTPLAYDLMEPFRPCVDFRVMEWVKRQNCEELKITKEFKQWITGFVLEKVGYFNLEIEIRYCIERVLRSFRQAVLTGHVRNYKPWTVSI